jgi:hypothetical protein
LQEVAGIVAANAEPALQLAALFAPYTSLLELDPVQHAAAFAAGACFCSLTPSATMQTRLVSNCIFNPVVDRMCKYNANVNTISTACTVVAR